MCVWERDRERVLQAVYGGLKKGQLYQFKKKIKADKAARERERDTTTLLLHSGSFAWLTTIGNKIKFKSKKFEISVELHFFVKLTISKNIEVDDVQELKIEIRAYLEIKRENVIFN